MLRRICAIVLFAFAATVASAAVRADDFAAHFIKTDPPAELPLFSITDAANNTLNLKDFAGRYVLLNLWATWCAPCIRELGSLDTLQDKMTAQKFTVIALTEDVNGRDAAQGFFKRHNIQHLTVYADTAGSVPGLLHARGLPVTYLIDPQGRAIGHVEGDADWATPNSIAFLTSLMSR